MKQIPCGKVITIGKIWEYVARLSGGSLSRQEFLVRLRSGQVTSVWKTLKANGELSEKYPGSVTGQKKWKRKGIQ